MMMPLVLVLALSIGQEPPQLNIRGTGGVRHPSSVRAIAITPDSKTAYVGLDDGSLHAYSLATRKKAVLGFRVYGILYDLAINARGDRIAVVDGEGFVTLLDTADNRVVKTARLKATPEHVRFHPDGNSLYVAMANGHLTRLATADLTVQEDIFPTDGSRVLALACSRDGKTVATSDRDGNIKIWSAFTLALEKSWKAHPILARSLAFDPSEKFLISGGEGAELKIWNLADYSLHKESKEFHQSAVQTIAFAADGRLVTGGYDGLCQFWNGKTFEGQKSYPNYRGYILACATTPDGRWLVRGGTFLDFVPLDRPDNFERVAEFGGAILGLSVAPDKKSFATGGLDRRLVAWRFEKGIDSKSILLDDWLTAVAYCRGGGSIAVAFANGKIAVYSADNLKQESSWTAHKGRVTGLGVVLGKLVSVGADGAAHVWSLDGQKLKSFSRTASCQALAVHGDRFAVGSVDGNISVYDADSQTPIKSIRGRPFSITALAFSTPGKHLLVGYFDGAMESFDAASWSTHRFLAGKGQSILTIDPHPKLDLAAVGFRDGFARIVDVSTLQERGSIQSRPAREVFAIRWLLAGNTFIAAGANNGVGFFNIENIDDVNRRVVLDVSSRITRGDLRDAVRRKSFRKIFFVKLEQGHTYQIDMTSPVLDSYLRLENSAGRQLAFDDDSGGFPHARIVFTPSVSGRYRIIATTFGDETTGDFRLKVTGTKQADMSR